MFAQVQVYHGNLLVLLHDVLQRVQHSGVLAHSVGVLHHPVRHDDEAPDQAHAEVWIRPMVVWQEDVCCRRKEG